MPQYDEETHFQLYCAVSDRNAVEDLARTAPPSSLVPVSSLCSYAERADGLFDLKIERLLREQPMARSVYSKAVGNMASSYSLMAAAAGGARANTRVVGNYKLEIVDEEEIAYIVLHQTSEDEHARWIEVRSPDGRGGRAELGEPIGGVIQLPLDPRVAELREIDEVIRQPDTQIFLLPK